MTDISNIAEGLALAERDYKLIAKNGTQKDVKPKEDQIKCALYKVFNDKGYLVHVEASLDTSRERCDLIAYKGRSHVVAIEIKTAWAGVGWVNKPAMQASTWVADIQKLIKLRKNEYVTHGFFILCFCYEKNSNGENGLRKEISNIFKLGYFEFKPIKIKSWNGLNEIQFFVLEVV